MKKRVLCMILTLVMIFSLVPSVAAASDEATEAAEALYELGLFKGTGTNPDGTPIFDLDKTPTRNQAIIMLVRLLGKEEEAKAGTWKIPFTDVSDAMRPYIGYAYTNGLTNGYTATTYCGGNPIRANQYIAFVLRALGYVSGEDFEVPTSWELSNKLGITHGQYDQAPTFLRGGIAQVSYHALGAVLKNSHTTLLEKLQAEGSVKSNNEATISTLDQITYRPIDESCIYFSPTPKLKDFTLLGVDYAVVGTDVYFRMRFKSATVVNFLVVPLVRFSDTSGTMEKFDADAKSGEFICKLPISTFEKYSQIDISPTEDGHQGPDIFITPGLFLTETGSAPVFQQADYQDASEDVADFKFENLEYAETVGGRVYRMTFQNTERRLIQFWALKNGQASGWNRDIAGIFRPESGDTTIDYFVSDQTMADYDFVFIRVRDAFSIDPNGGSEQNHCWIRCDFR